MKPLLKTVTDSELIAFVDCWAALLEEENYEAAFEFTAHIPKMQWTPSLVKYVIKRYGEADPNQKVTLDAISTEIRQRQRKDVCRWTP